MSTRQKMKAVVVETSDGPEALDIKDVPIPEAKPGWVRIYVNTFGLNRSELLTRQGHSLGVQFPHIPIRTP